MKSEKGAGKMDGIILLNKEKDISSFKAINNLKYKLKLKKVGHAGTLDPLAEGNRRLRGGARDLRPDEVPGLASHARPGG